jgi:formate dehydrogenase accessory protein FdhD
MTRRDVATDDAHAWPAVHGDRVGRRLSEEGASDLTVTVAEEVPVAMVFNGTSHAVMIATPADLDDFGLGFALSEGIVGDRSELLDIETHSGEGGLEVRMTITQRRFALLAARRRTLAGRTGCGLCGVDSLAQVLRPIAAVTGDTRIEPAAIRLALTGLRDHQPLNRSTGAVHGAAFVDPGGKILLAREDVGRHNALDKLLGAVVLAGHQPVNGFVLLTSRCSFEMVQKAASCGVAVLVAISAPTGLALRLAEETGVTVVALARADSMIAHTHGYRLGLDGPSNRPSV